MRRIAPIVLILLLAAAGAWWFGLPARLGWTDPQADQLILYGNVDIREVQLGFRVSGRVADMAVDEGDSVEAGDVLAHLDARPYEDDVRAAQAQVAARSATLDKLVAGPRKAELAQGRAALAESQADLANARQYYERTSQLRPGGSISQADLDEAEAAKDMAAARVASAEAALRLLEEGTRPEDLAVGRANLQAAKANLAAAQTALDDTRLLAPAAGVILSRVREPGSIVAAGDPIYVLSLREPVWVRTYVAEPNLGRIHPGMEVEVVSDTFPERPYSGQIGFISPVAEFTPKSVETPELRTDLVYRLRVVVDGADAGLRQGMPVTVRVPLGAPRSGGEREAPDAG